MVKRQIITIDEDKCNGCGNCVTGCSEGALKIIDGKAKLVKEEFCDGFGDCIGECPTGALKITKKESKPFNLDKTKEHVENIRGEKGVEEMIKAQQKHEDHQQTPTGGCPGMRMRMMNDDHKGEKNKTTAQNESTNVKSQLRQWPVQIHLLSPQAPYFKDANILVTADCVPTAYVNFQQLIKGKTIALGCPKLDDAAAYVNKLTAIIQNNNLKSISVARMEVPCCGGLVRIVEQALANAKTDLDLNVINISIEGEILH